MTPLKCPICKRDVPKLVNSRDAPKMVCPECKHGVRRDPGFSAHVFPADGVFLEHVSPKGHRFFSKQEMLNWERKTGTYIDAAH